MKNIQIDAIDINLNRKAIKNLYIRIKPPAGQVVVSVPMHLSDKQVMQFINERLDWIKKQQQRFVNYHEPSYFQYLNDETHYLWGEAYPLKVIERHGKHEVIKRDERLHLYACADISTEKKALLMTSFYKKHIFEKLESLVPLWEQTMSIVAPEIRLRTMKTRWGSCRVDGARIWLNTELAKRPLESLEYVLVHEMTHLFEPSHNHRFKALMDRFLPDWRERKLRLNNPLP